MPSPLPRQRLRRTTPESAFSAWQSLFKVAADRIRRISIQHCGRCFIRGIDPAKMSSDTGKPPTQSFSILTVVSVVVRNLETKIVSGAMLELILAVSEGKNLYLLLSSYDSPSECAQISKSLTRPQRWRYCIILASSAETMVARLTNTFSLHLPRALAAPIAALINISQLYLDLWQFHRQTALFARCQ